ncbi:MAG: response regulator [Isosphaeraceae bacterium]
MGASAQLTSVAPGEPAVAGGRDREEDAAISVLLIEDNEADAYLVSESLANSQPPRFKITHRDRLSSGLACLSHESFDLVLVDLSLPDSDGFETFRRVRESSPSIPIVVLTGRDDQDLANKTARAGGQDYLLKRSTGGELLKRLMRQAIDRKRIEEALKKADTRKNEFLAMLAHELRNPLAALECGLSLLKAAGQESDREWALTMAEHQVRLLARMVEDLLDTSRITRGTFQLRRERVRPAELIERAVDTMRHFAQTKEHRLHIMVGPNLPQLEADPSRLEQVIFNLLSNAFKFTPQGGRVEVSAVAEGGELVLKVRDTGSGITPDFLPHIFEPFVQAEATLARERGGLGVGLTLVKAIVELHGGSVEARSEGLHLGSEFVVRLPTVGADDAVGSGPSSLQDRPSLGVDGAPERRRILMVEDNLDYALGLRRLLESAGHEVQICNHGFGAISQAPAFVPDVILLDLGLPGMDGYEVARRMRENESLARTKIVVISGYACEEDRRLSREIGVDEHLAKPVRFSDLLRVITETGRSPRT